MIRAFEDQLRHSGSWEIYQTNDVTTIFRFNHGAEESGQERPAECIVGGWFSGAACGVGRSVARVGHLDWPSVPSGS